MALIKEGKNSTSNKGILDEKNIINKKNSTNDKQKVINSIARIFPVKDYADFDFFEMKNDEYMEIVQITSKDIYSLNEQDKDNDIFSLAYLFQAYLPDLKIVPMNVPVNLEVQKNKIQKKIRNCKKEEYLPFLEKKLYELEFLEEHRTNKEFFFFLYAKSPQELLDRKNHIKKLLSKSNPLIELDIEKKVNVLFQLSNLNTKPKVN